MRRALLLAAVLSALLAPAPAGASPYVRYGIQDDAWLEFGPGTLEDRLRTLEGLGVDLVRFSLHWNRIAEQRPADARSPDDPAYDWRLADRVLGGLRERGIAPVVGLVGTPGWANGGRSSAVAPDDGTAFGDFAYAAARRYPWVRYWLVWNEPNQRRWLQPTSPPVYVKRLLVPAYDAIHEAAPRALVGGGVTAPRGGPGGVSPVDWILGMAEAGARLDAYAHHPYPSNPAETPFTGGCPRCKTITIADLERLLSVVGRAFGPKRIWLTEFGYQTRPPDPFGVSRARQARYIGEAAYRAYKAPRVDMLIQYLYRDEPELVRFQSGLVGRDGAAKPALAAFRLPLAQVSRKGDRVVVWGQVRPGTRSDGSGRRTYRLQVRVGGAWRWVGATSVTTPRGFFMRTIRARKGVVVRVWTTEDRAFSWALTIS